MVWERREGLTPEQWEPLLSLQTFKDLPKWLLLISLQKQQVENDQQDLSFGSKSIGVPASVGGICHHGGEGRYSKLLEGRSYPHIFQTL